MTMGAGFPRKATRTSDAVRAQRGPARRTTDLG